MSKVIETGRFVIYLNQDGKRVYLQLDPILNWTDNIKDASIFGSDKIARMEIYANELENLECNVIGLAKTKANEKK